MNKTEILRKLYSVAFHMENDQETEKLLAVIYELEAEWQIFLT